MIQIRAFVLTACLTLLAAAGTAWGSSEDMPGSRDFEGLPRVDGTHIAGYLYSEYDAGRFVTRTDDRNRAVLARPEGKRTRIIYLGRESQTPLQLMRNYQKAFEAFGDYEELYSCTGEACDRNLASGVLWAEDNRIKTSFRNPYSLYLGRYTDVRYVYGTLYKGEKVYHVSVFSNFQKGGQTGIFNLPIVHVEILEMESFEPSLVFVGADEISNAINESGAISLYGIQFRFDSAELAPESAATLQEVATALKATPDLNVFVVGHTDNAGALDYNRRLSGERAAAVVEALVRDHGITENRLAAVGIGPVAPKASNDTEAGRKLNRRVEIVKR